MTDEERMGEALREAIAVPTDTMITLDIPLLLTRLSRVPSVPQAPAPQEPRPPTPPGHDDT